MNSISIKPAKRTQQVETYYFASKLQEIQTMRNQGADVINLGIGSPDQPPHDFVIESLSKSASQPHHHGYQSYKGTDALRAAYSTWYKRFFSVELNPKDEILPLMGSKEGIMHISMAFLDPGDKVLVPDPGYPTYSAVTRMLGGEVVYYPLKEENKWLPDLPALEKTDLRKVKMMWVNYPHMPTGTAATTMLLEELVGFANRNRILIINDNPYAFILNNNPLSILSVPGSRDVALELNSLSKSHNMPGWRMGMVAGNAQLLNEILKVKSNMDSGMFLPIMEAAVVALKLDSEWYDSMNQLYASRRDSAFKLFDTLGCSYNKHQTGLFVWAAIPSGESDAASLSDTLLKDSHVFITPGFIFGQQGKRFLRISLCTPQNRLEEACQRIKSLMKTKNND